MKSLAEKLHQVIDNEPVIEGQGMPKAGWAQKVKQFVADLKSEFIVSMKRDAQGGDFNDLLSRVYPSMLYQMSVTLKKMFPQETTRQRRLLNIVGQELEALTQGIVTVEDTEKGLGTRERDDLSEAVAGYFWKKAMKAADDSLSETADMIKKELPKKLLLAGLEDPKVTDVKLGGDGFMTVKGTIGQPYKYRNKPPKEWSAQIRIGFESSLYMMVQGGKSRMKSRKEVPGMGAGYNICADVIVGKLKDLLVTGKM